MNKDFIYKRRLLKLADFLQKLPRKRFNYASWVGEDWQGKENLSCGTTACAFGWAATIPSLRKAGLRMKKVSGRGYVTLKNSKYNNDFTMPRIAATEVFGLNNNEFEYLFLPDTWLTTDSNMLGDSESILGLSGSPNDKADAKEVAKHIRRFVKARYK
jgi:hypothetical protein